MLLGGGGWTIVVYVIGERAATVMVLELTWAGSVPAAWQRLAIDCPVGEEDEEMARSELTPLGTVVRGLVAGAVGTAAMDLFQFARYKLGGGGERLLAWEFSAGLKDWEQAPAPAQIGKRVVEGVFQRQLPPERAALTNNLAHWGYGIAWGGLFGLVEGSVRSSRVDHGLALGAAVWTISYIFLPLAKLYRPIWEYDVKVLAKDLGDQLVYGLGAAGAYRLLAGR